ncbi:glycosyltransferase family 2 protein [Flavobacterium phycosphaerae]|uniref:glycosyltransferase family 2 protein n=1 Tax=Flavobacterium phycosphaerae TaxID=2697515 RepID=UPI00138A2129|nr:glycosyltransferase family A protein [Flavobacterium phycosphaerae]
MPFFTVVIPLFNKETFIVNAINSILNQTFQDFEIIVVEDGSTDKSLAKVTSIQSDAIQIIQHDKNKGLSAARNTGIQKAKADYITFLDADDVWKPHYLAKIHSLIVQFPEAQLFATNYEELHQNNIVLVSKNDKIPKTDSLIPDFFDCNLARPIYFPGSLCVAKTVFKAIGSFDESITFAEDVDFNIRANAQFQLAYSPEVMVTYTLFSENQITNSRFSSKTIPNFNAYEAMAKTNPSLKKYLDFNRYIMARSYKMEQHWENYKKLKNEIDTNSLNFKQRWLLKAPVTLLVWVKKIKLFFIGKGISITTYD